MSMTVDEMGNVLQTSLQVDNQPLNMVMDKEDSTQLVECFEGRWSGEFNGIWNIVLKGNAIKGSYDGDASGLFEGSLEGSHIDIVDSGGSDLATGSRRGDAMSGSWQFFTYSGTWSGKRTL